MAPAYAKEDRKTEPQIMRAEKSLFRRRALKSSRHDKIPASASAQRIKAGSVPVVKLSAARVK